MRTSILNSITRLAYGTSCVAFAFALVACEGPIGMEGPAGADGKDGVAGADGKDGVAGADGKDGVAGADGKDGLAGADGKDGKDGADASTIGYAGSAKCASCHKEHAAQVAASGHPYKLNKVVGGKAPTYPFDNVTGGVPAPPLGLSWNDITYVIGGFGWKARYIGKDGYIVTGGADDLTQWSYPNKELGLPGKWVAYHPGQKKPYNCGSCHTTGWIPCDVGDTTCKHQDGLEGMAGSFQETGVQCEACHGPGAAHAATPYLVPATIDRSPELCGKCHVRGAVESVNASGGFITHHEQYEELFAGKKHSMRCVDCHNPHKSVKYAEPTVNPEKGIRIGCVSCHVGYETQQKSNYMAKNVNCIDCHMPKIVKSAMGDASKYMGDIRTHFFHINTTQSEGQFSADGSSANPYVSLDWSCKSCHRAGGDASVKTDAALEAMAKGYHL